MGMCAAIKENQAKAIRQRAEGGNEPAASLATTTLEEISAMVKTILTMHSGSEP